MNEQKWFSTVDSLLVDFVGMCHDDIPDYNWMSLYSEGLDAEEAFEEWRQDLDYGFPSIF